MKNKFQVQLINESIKESKSTEQSSVLVRRNVNLISLLDAVLNECDEYEREIVIRIVSKLSRKVAELENHGDTFDKRKVQFNPEMEVLCMDQLIAVVNRKLTKFEQSGDTNKTSEVDRTEPLEESTTKNIEENLAREMNKLRYDSPEIQTALFGRDDIPACGIAFRQWLMQGK